MARRMYRARKIQQVINTQIVEVSAGSFQEAVTKLRRGDGRIVKSGSRTYEPRIEMLRPVDEDIPLFPNKKKAAK